MQYQMQGVVDGALYTWLADEPDWNGAEYSGGPPGTPTEIAVAARPGGGGGGGSVDSARRAFKSDFAGTIPAGGYVDLGVTVTGTVVGDMCTTYMTSTSAAAWPDIELTVRATFTNQVRVRLRNFGESDAEIEGGQLTFYAHSFQYTSV